MGNPVAAGEGLEPSLAESKSAVLTITLTCDNRKPAYFSRSFKTLLNSKSFAKFTLAV